MSEWNDKYEYRLSSQDWNVYTESELLSNAIKWENKTEKQAKKCGKNAKFIIIKNISCVHVI